MGSFMFRPRIADTTFEEQVVFNGVLLKDAPRSDCGQTQEHFESVRTT